MQFSRIKTLLQNKVTLFLCCCVALASCDDPNELGLGLVDDNISGRYTDTLTVNVSTVFLDSLTTSGSGTMLAGQYSNPYSGTLIANAFFQVGLGSTAWTVTGDVTYDSLKLVMPYSSYYYGDTTQAAAFDIYRVTSALAPRPLSPYFFNEEPYSILYANNGLYNVSKTATTSEAISSFTITPRPVSKDTIAISLSDELGQEWLGLKKANDPRLTEAASFLNYFQGLEIASTAGSAVVGFSSTPALVRLYYTETVDGTSTARTRDFPVNPTLQYNQLLTDFEGSQLAGIMRGSEAVPASQTGNVSVAQGGAGLMIRIDVPYLEKLKALVPAELINRAVLVVEPLNNTTQFPYPAPAFLGLYTTNSSNVPLNAISSQTSSGPAAVTYKYTEPDQQNPSGRYDFNITSYLREYLNKENPGSFAYLLAPPPASFTQGVSKLVVGGAGSQQQSIKLRVYYTTIK